MKTGWTYLTRLLTGIVLAALLTGAAAAQTPIGTRIDNRAALRYRTSGMLPDSTSSNLASVLVTGTLTLSLQKTVAPATAFPGDTVTYTVAARNAGSSPLTGVAIVDTVPGQCSVISVSHGNAAGNIVRWNLGTSAAGERDTLRIMAIVHQMVPAGTIVTNRCFGNDTTGTRVVASTDLAIGAAPRLDLRKSVSSVSVNGGDTISWIIRYSNTGNTTLSGFALRDTVPSTTQITGVSGGAGISGRVISIDRDSLPLTMRDSVVISAIITKPVAGGTTIANTAHAVTRETPAQVSSAFSTVRSIAGITLTKVASADTAAPGDTVRFTLRFHNTGNVVLTNLVITDSMPSAFIALPGPANVRVVNGLYSYSYDSLANGHTDSLVLVTRVAGAFQASMIATNHAQVVTDQTPRESAQTSLVILPVHVPPAITFVKEGPETGFSGNTGVYTLTAVNHGPGPLTGVTITDTLDPRMKFLSASDGSTVDTVARTIRWAVARIDSGAMIAMTATVTYSDTISKFAVLTNQGALSANEILPLSSQVQTAVRPPAKLSIWKVASSRRAVTGDTLTYTIAVENISSVRADSVVVTDPLPHEFGFLSASPAAGLSTAGGIPEWRLDTLAAGGQREFTITTSVGTIPDRGESVITNVASTKWAGGHASSSDDPRTKADVTLFTPYLQVTKQAVRRIVEIGDAALYTITVTNLSRTTPAYRVTLIDHPPLGFAMISGASFRDSVKTSDPAVTGSTLRWAIADSLLPGRTVQLTYRLLVGAGALDGTGINRAQAVAQAPDGLSIESAIASDRVEVKAGVFTDRGLIVGKVFYDDDESTTQETGEEGIRGIELLMEDGTRVVTGDDGKYSLPEVAPGEHVIRLRQETLPRGDELLLGYGEFAGVASSRFVNVPESGIARADFYVRRGTSGTTAVAQQAAGIGSVTIRRITEPRNILFVKDEILAPITIKGTQFEVGKAVLRSEAFPTLKAVADYARQYADQNIAVSGHTDSMPIHTKEYPSNRELSEARANAVRDYLIEKEHIEPARISTIGFGETEPAAPNSTKSGRALNRRVEIMMSSGANPFGNYFRKIRMSVAVDYEGPVPLLHVEVRDRLDSAFHFVDGSARLENQPITPGVTADGLSWKIDSLGLRFHKVISYEVNVFAPVKGLETARSTSTLSILCADSVRKNAGVCVTRNIIESTTHSKPVRFVLSGVLFDAGKADLKPEALNSLKSAADVLSGVPASTAVIEGFTDSKPITRGAYTSNVALSHARAAAVMSQLADKFGIDRTRLQSTGWGELKPVATNSTEEGRRANRRVEISIDKKEIRESTITEGSADTSERAGQEIRACKDEPVAFDTAARVLSGNHFYLKVAAQTASENRIAYVEIVDSLPQGFTTGANNVSALRGIDSVWNEAGTLHLRCTAGDSLHVYTMMVEHAAGDDSAETAHRIVIRKHLKNGMVADEISSPMLIRLADRRTLR